MWENEILIVCVYLSISVCVNIKFLNYIYLGKSNLKDKVDTFLKIKIIVIFMYI